MIANARLYMCLQMQNKMSLNLNFGRIMSEFGRMGRICCDYNYVSIINFVQRYSVMSRLVNQEFCYCQLCKLNLLKVL